MLESLLLVMVLCSRSTGQCDNHVIDSNLTIDGCNQARVELLSAHAKREAKGLYGSYIQSANCVVEDKE